MTMPWETPPRRVSPYKLGDEIAILRPDPAGMRVYRDRVERVTKTGQDSWVVKTTRGQGEVDHTGEGRNLVPIDAEMQQLFTESGDGFVVEPTDIPLESVLHLVLGDSQWDIPPSERYMQDKLRPARRLDRLPDPEPEREPEQDLDQRGSDGSIDGREGYGA